ncbi:MAG: LysR family transcriptional regulator [Pseudomonadota bacterium]
MRQLDGLMEFCAVVDHGGFTRASEALGLSASFVSRRVADLEARLGVRLLHRTTRRVNLTELGATYYERATAILSDINALETDLAEQQNLVKGHIRVAAGGRFGETWVSEAMAEFASLHPEVEITLEVSDRRVDLIREGFDLAVRHSMPSDPDLIVRKIGSRRMIVCAAPDYLEIHGYPESPADLVKHCCLAAPGQKWMFQSGGPQFEVKVRGRWVSNSGPALAIACMTGLGIIRLGETYVSDAINEGSLVPLLEAHEIAPQETVLVYPSRERLPVRIRELISYIAERSGVS